MQRPSKLLFCSIIGVILGINLISLIWVFNFSPDIPLSQRPTTINGSVPIIYGGDTEELGYLDNENLSLYWFIHITDIHLNRNASNEYNVNFSRFLNYSYNTIHPFTMINTGDLTTGSHYPYYNSMDPRGYEEFQNYKSIIDASPYATDTNVYRYIDVAGNHDRNMDWNTAQFLNCTLTGQRLGSLQAFFSANFSQGTAAFSILDSSGPNNGFPVFLASEGNMDSSDMAEYVNFLEATKSADTKFSFEHQHPVITFGTANSPSSIFPQNVLGLNRLYNIDAFFYGHSHMDFTETYDNTVLTMGDRFRDVLAYKIISVDNGGVNIQSVNYEAGPAVIITNPSNPLLIDEKDSIQNTRGDGLVRALVFPQESDPIKTVEYQIDNGDWITMNNHPNSVGLFESSRNGNPAIPADNQEHIVHIRVRTQNGMEKIIDATSTTSAKRVWFFQGIFLGLYIGLAAVIVFMNRDNYPLRRADGKRRRLTHQEKVNKRIEHNQKTARPWWMSTLGWGILMNFLFVPWAITPIVKGTPGAVYSLGIITTIGNFSLIEPLVYTAGIVLVGFAALYWGIRTYHPTAVSLGSFITVVNGIVMISMGLKDYGTAGLILPGAYFYILLGTVLLIGNFKHTFTYRTISKIVTKLKPHEKTVPMKQV